MTTGALDDRADSSAVPCVTCCVKYYFKKKVSYHKQWSQLILQRAFHGLRTPASLSRSDCSSITSHAFTKNLQTIVIASSLRQLRSLRPHSDLYIIYISHHAAWTDPSKHAQRFIHQQWLHHKSTLNNSVPVILSWTEQSVIIGLHYAT